jgi:F-type H+-transporting ATPase subunit delta
LDFLGDIGVEISKELKNFINLLAESNRLYLLPEMSEQFNMLKMQHEKVKNIIAITAVELDEDQRLVLTKRLEKQLNSRVKINYQVDYSLIGGLIIKVGDEVVDKSIHGQLQQLNKQLVA